jgi:hypothetical protein
MRTLGIVPAAGKAKRFGGIMKECLPDRNGIALIKRTVAQLYQFCDDVVVISNAKKISEHARVLGTECTYRIQGPTSDIWGAISEGIKIPADRYWFQMPDTIVQYGLLLHDDPKFAMGVFDTDKPERFGCLQDGWVLDKSDQVESPAKAWGVLRWKREVVDLWNEEGPIDYTDAINMAIGMFDYETFELKSYNDMASVQDYLEYLRE